MNFNFHAPVNSGGVQCNSPDGEIYPETWQYYPSVSNQIFPEQVIKREKEHSMEIPNTTTPGIISRNELNTPSNNFCAGTNWVLLVHNGEICEWTPFLNSYNPFKEMTTTGCCTICTSEENKE